MFEDPMELREGFDFQIVNVNDGEVGIQFDDLTFMIDYVNLGEDEDEDGNITLHFNYRVLEYGAEIEEHASENHEQKLGAIIEKMLREEYQYQTNGE